MIKDEGVANMGRMMSDKLLELSISKYVIIE